MVKDGRLCKDDIDVVLEEKRQIIKKSSLLEYIGGGIRMDEVGGLDNLKSWLAKRNDSWSEEAVAYGLSAPKGVLLTGVPGCGKSLIAKAVSTLWQLPLLRLDVGKLFGMWVGTSESNIRSAIQLAEAIAPCVLWIDEIEKGFRGVGSSGDSGTASRVFGTFLTWMQEKSKMVFVIATANDISGLPPELMRKGRFDEIFFVDLPNQEERSQIVRVHLQRRLKRTMDETVIRTIVEKTEGFSGAELEQAIVSGLFEAFAERRPVTLDDMLTAIRATVPLSVTQAEKITELRQWAAIRAIPATSPKLMEKYRPRSNVTIVD
jgi:SpoVK/Ycf46/Vps4 family AAA+-type ATPase